MCASSGIRMPAGSSGSSGSASSASRPRGAPERLGVPRRQGGSKEIGDLARTLDGRGEVPQIGVQVAVFFAGDLAFGHFFDDLGSTQGDCRRRKLQTRQLSSQRGDIGIRLIGEQSRGGGVTLLQQQVLDAMPADPRRIGLVGEIVDARIDRTVDLLDQARDRPNLRSG
jgi:hypothetical protein